MTVTKGCESPATSTLKQRNYFSVHKIIYFLSHQFEQHNQSTGIYLIPKECINYHKQLSIMRFKSQIIILCARTLAGEFKITQVTTTAIILSTAA